MCENDWHVVGCVCVNFCICMYMMKRLAYIYICVSLSQFSARGKPLAPSTRAINEWPVFKGSPRPSASMREKFTEDLMRVDSCNATQHIAGH